MLSTKSIIVIIVALAAFVIACVYLYCLLKSGSDPKIAYVNNNDPKVMKKFTPPGKCTVKQVLESLVDNENKNYIVYLIVVYENNIFGHSILEYRNGSNISNDRKLLGKYGECPVRYVTKLENATDEFVIKVCADDCKREQSDKDNM